MQNIKINLKILVFWSIRQFLVHHCEMFVSSVSNWFLYNVERPCLGKVFSGQMGE